MLSRVIFLLVIGTVSSTSLSKFLLQRHRPVDHEDVQLKVARRIPWDQETIYRAAEFPCPEKGFYRHPTNCSRFYRCVNFNDKSSEFSIFLYECQQGDKFVPGIDVCIPGKCSDNEHAMPSDDPFGSDGASSSDSGSSVGDSQGGNEETGGSTAESGGGEGGSGASGQSGGTGADSQGSGAGSGGSGVDGTGDMSPSGCIGMYQADTMYCNRYHICGDTSLKFQCGYGTVFSEENQMCRLKRFNEELCNGKEIHPESEFKVASPYNIIEVSPNRNAIQLRFETPTWPQTLKEYPDPHNLAIDPLFSSDHLFNPDLDSKETQVYDKYKPLHSSQKYAPHRKTSQTNEHPWKDLFAPSYAPAAPFVQNTLPKFTPYRRNYQPMYYNIPFNLYSHQQNDFNSRNRFINPYNFRSSFYPNTQFPQRNRYSHPHAYMDASRESNESYGSD